jgi:hypothetical protein
MVFFEITLQNKIAFLNFKFSSVVDRNVYLTRDLALKNGKSRYIQRNNFPHFPLLCSKMSRSFRPAHSGDPIQMTQVAKMICIAPQTDT